MKIQVKLCLQAKVSLSNEFLFHLYERIETTSSKFEIS